MYIKRGETKGDPLSITFSVYLDELLNDLRPLNSGCYRNGNFVRAVIDADDITLMGPTRSCIMPFLNECDVYARKHDSWYNHVKLTVFSPSCVNSVSGQMLSFMNAHITTLILRQTKYYLILNI